MTEPRVAHASKESPEGGSAARAEVQAMLDKFARALTSGDLDTLCQLWAVPSLVLHEGTGRTVGSLDEVRQFFGQAPAQYHARGVVGTRAEVTQFDWLTDKIASVHVRWPYVDVQGHETGEERSTYWVMRGEDKRWKIWGAAMQGASQPH